MTSQEVLLSMSGDIILHLSMAQVDFKRDYGEVLYDYESLRVMYVWHVRRLLVTLPNANYEYAY